MCVCVCIDIVLLLLYIVPGIILCSRETNLYSDKSHMYTIRAHVRRFGATCDFGLPFKGGLYTGGIDRISKRVLFRGKQIVYDVQHGQIRKTTGTRKFALPANPLNRTTNRTEKTKRFYAL